MAERAEELRQQLDMQRADISRTVEQIENRVVPSRVFNRRKYRMRRSMLDVKDRLFGNDERDYPSHWYAQPAAPLGPEYGSSYPQGTQYGFEGGSGGGGGRLGEARERAGGAMHEASDRASGAVHSASEAASGAAHSASERASGVAHSASDRASGVVHGAQDTMHTMGDRLGETPQLLRRQTQGSPMALGLVAFGAGLLAGSVLPESRREQQLARQAEPQLQAAVEGTRGLAGEVVADLRESAQESAQDLKQTATDEAQAFKQDATSEAQATKSDVSSAARE